MFIKDGIVYGGEPKKPIKIEKVKVLPDMMLLIQFNNGELRLFDATTLEGLKKASKKYIEKELGVVQKEIDKCNKKIDDLNEMKENISKLLQ